MYQLPSPSRDPANHVPAQRPQIEIGGAPPGRPDFAWPVQDEDDTIARYWAGIWGAKWIILACTAAGIVLGLVITLIQVPEYKARTTIELQTANTNYLDIRSIDPTNTANDSLDTFMQTQIQVLQSETLLDRTVQRLKREFAALPKPPKQSGLRGQMPIAAEPPSQTVEEAAWYIAANLNIKGSGLTRLVEVVCQSPHPELATAFANALANEYIEQNLENRWESSRRTADWLTKKVDELKNKLQSAEEALQSYSRASGLIFSGEAGNVGEERLKRIETELSTAHMERMQKQARYEQALNASPDSIPEVLESGDVREYQSKLMDLRRQVAEFGTSMRPEHPKMERLQAQITELSGELNRKRENVIRRLRNEYEAAQRRERMLEEADAQQRREVGAQLAKTTRYNLLKREVDGTRQMYESMHQKLKEVGVAAAMPLSNVRIVNPAKVPSVPAIPSKTLNAAVGLVSGALIGMVIGVTRRQSDRRLNLPGEAASLLGVPEIGVVPALKCDPTARGSVLGKLRLGRESRPVTQGLLDAPNATPARRKGDIDLPLIGRAESLMAEAYRATIPGILFANEQGQLHTLVVSSANPREGKTSLISNIAIGLADMSKRVLLIDGDVHNARLHDVFGVPNYAGLSDLLEAADPTISSGPVQTNAPSLFLLPAGMPTARTRNLLYSPKMAQLLASYRNQFDLILVDSAPVLPLRDARLLGRLADAVLLVVRAGQTSREAATAAAAKFRSDGTPILGVVLNDFNPKQGSAVYGSDYLNGYRRFQHT